jgi:hypothetical protein
MRGAVPPHSQYVFMALCLVKPRENFTFTFTFAYIVTANYELKKVWKGKCCGLF